MLNQLADGLLDQFIDYCSKDESRQKLEARVLRPALQYLAERFAWGIRVFQAVAVLVLIQTLVLLWVLLRESRSAGA
jgi:hypothetical protein